MRKLERLQGCGKIFAHNSLLVVTVVFSSYSENGKCTNDQREYESETKTNQISSNPDVSVSTGKSKRNQTLRHMKPDSPRCSVRGGSKTPSWVRCQPSWNYEQKLCTDNSSDKFFLIDPTVDVLSEIYFFHIKHNI